MSHEEQSVQDEISKTTDALLLPETSFQYFREKLAAYINELINQDFAKLISWLYRLDVSENKIKQSLGDKHAEDAGLIIADIVIERQLEKIKLRREFSGRNENIDEGEKW